MIERALGKMVVGNLISTAALSTFTMYHDNPAKTVETFKQGWS